MNAVKFLKLFGRMCKTYKLCKGCPINEADIECSNELLEDNAQTIYEIVDRWSRENKY